MIFNLTILEFKDNFLQMTEEIEAHVLKKYEILQKLGKYGVLDTELIAVVVC